MSVICRNERMVLKSPVTSETRDMYHYVTGRSAEQCEHRA